MKEKKKKITIELTEEEYEEFEIGRKKHFLDKTNYVKFLMKEDKNNLQSKKAAEAVDKISASTVNINSNNKDQCLEPFIIELKEGVKELWQCLQ